MLDLGQDKLSDASLIGADAGIVGFLSEVSSLEDQEIIDLGYARDMPAEVEPVTDQARGGPIPPTSYGIATTPPYPVPLGGSAAE